MPYAGLCIGGPLDGRWKVSEHERFYGMACSRRTGHVDRTGYLWCRLHGGIGVFVADSVAREHGFPSDRGDTVRAILGRLLQHYRPDAGPPAKRAPAGIA